MTLGCIKLEGVSESSPSSKAGYVLFVLWFGNIFDWQLSYQRPLCHPEVGGLGAGGVLPLSCWFPLLWLHLFHFVKKTLTD